MQIQLNKNHLKLVNVKLSSALEKAWNSRSKTEWANKQDKPITVGVGLSQMDHLRGISCLRREHNSLRCNGQFDFIIYAVKKK